MSIGFGEEGTDVGNILNITFQKYLFGKRKVCNSHIIENPLTGFRTQLKGQHQGLQKSIVTITEIENNLFFYHYLDCLVTTTKLDISCLYHGLNRQCGTGTSLKSVEQAPDKACQFFMNPKDQYFVLV